MCWRGEPKQIAKKMWALKLKDDEGNHEVIRVPVPKPGPNEVLIKIEAAPLNPSDLAYTKGLFKSWAYTAYPITPGFEASGTVVQSGGGFHGWALTGKRVACMKGTESTYGKLTKDGTYAEYMVTNVLCCIPLQKEVGFDEGSCHFVNPLTALGLIKRVKELHGKCVVLTAACS